MIRLSGYSEPLPPHLWYKPKRKQYFKKKLLHLPDKKPRIFHPPQTETTASNVKLQHSSGKDQDHLKLSWYLWEIIPKYQFSKVRETTKRTVTSRHTEREGVTRRGWEKTQKQPLLRASKIQKQHLYSLCQRQFI